MKIAIDGPAGAGKSVVAQRLAERMGYLYLDTGAMYRALALLALRRAAPVTKEQPLAMLAQSAHIVLTPDRDSDGRQYTVLLDGEDVTWSIRSQEVEAVVSQISEHPLVRAEMVAKQRVMGGHAGVIMAGRDIGTVVLPDADLKIFLTASTDERARRRVLELQARGQATRIDEVAAAMRQRDEIDSQRAASPLTVAQGAHVIHSDGMTIDEVVGAIVRLALVAVA